MSFITPAYAQAAGGGAASFMNFAPLLLIFVIMYFLMIRPQRAQMKRHQEMINAVRRGDSVVTGGGFIGKVTKVFDAEGEVEVELADNVRVRVLRSTLSNVRTKSEVATEKTATKANNKDRGNKNDKKTDEKVDKDDSNETAVDNDQASENK
ncbi:preprotein translocase subunit YajC [Bartonella sp. HY329]|uniref:preprotein translocase subunit YajC n=1 Tax=unclassified Bartonella TaxID=2645622 RepID=UPI0021CACC5C|nr:MULTISPECIES: preprotein translocase subunit YajC [unclassified Bartonella]UXM94054.1 preprotein translocase subunit YajC [Bartonella sp. HY329]UXN08376.1 preprotein translocase subunit YajC [Bartonella sp. HY328]